MSKVVLSLAGVLVPGMADAHTGHGVIDAQNVVAHQLIEPLHAIPLILLGAMIAGCAFLAVRWVRGENNRS